MADNRDGNDRNEPSEAAKRLISPNGPGGILTASDRRYLLHDHPAFPGVDWNGNDEPQKRLRIRKRIKNVLQDFLLVENLSERELELIFDDVYNGSESSDRPGRALSNTFATDQADVTEYGWGEQYEQLLSGMSLFYRACDVVPMLSFEDLVEATVRRNTPTYRDDASGTQGKRASNINVDVSIDVDIEWRDVYDADEIEAKIERGEPLARDEIGELFLQGRIEPGDLSPGDVRKHLFTAPNSDGELPGLEPSRPEPPEDWEDQMQAELTEEMAELVNWSAADRPADVWNQLEEHYENPVDRAYSASEDNSET